MGNNNNDFQAPWKEWAAKFGSSSRATFRDQIQFQMEVDKIYQLLSCEGERIFDIGCGNGATLKMLLELGLKPQAVAGCDALEEFIDIARQEVPSGVFTLTDFSKDDSTCFKVINEFNPTAVIIKRVLNNLSGRNQQRTVLKNICESLPSGAKIIIIEPIYEGLQKLNLLREFFGLSIISEPSFNEYVRYKDLFSTLKSNSIIEIRTEDYTSAYYIGSRIIQPFVNPGVEPDYNHIINKFFATLPNREGFGVHWLVTGVKS